MGTKKSSIPLIALGSAIGGILIANAFRTRRDFNKRKKSKKWLNWEIQFKEGTTGEEKAKIINKIEMHIMDHLFKTIMPGVIARSIKISYNPNTGNGQPQITVWVRFEIASTHGIKAPTPPGPPPLREILNNLPPLIQNIEILNTR